MSETTTTRISAPMHFPPAPFELDYAKLNLQFVNSAYDMYAQWLAAGKPKGDDFKWEPQKPSGMASELSISYSSPIWGTDTVFWIFKHPEPFAFVAWNEVGDVFLSIRGTDSPDDWLEDADADHVDYDLAPDYGTVHHGFYVIYKSMSEAIQKALSDVPNPKRLFISGHSLGSSLSTLAVPDVITNTDYKPGNLPVFHYNFASPRTGSPTFATTYNQNGVPTWRVVNSCDIVPTEPPSLFAKDNYEHIGIQVSYSAQYDSLGANHSSTNSYGYALENPDQPQGPVS